MDVQELAQVDSYILRIRDFDEPYAKQDFYRMKANGAILRVAHAQPFLRSKRVSHGSPISFAASSFTSSKARSN